MKNILFFLLVFFQISLFGQEINLMVEVSTDSILLGNYLEVKFTIENAGGDFDAPEFEGFVILSGPNTSSSFNMINGNVTQKASYSYIVKPVREGTLYIDPASFKTGGKVLETEPILIQVYPNPEGIEDNKPLLQENDQVSPFGSQSKPQKKLKHKLRKI